MKKAQNTDTKKAGRKVDISVAASLVVGFLARKSCEDSEHTVISQTQRELLGKHTDSLAQFSVC